MYASWWLKKHLQFLQSRIQGEVILCIVGATSSMCVLMILSGPMLGPVLVTEKAWVSLGPLSSPRTGHTIWVSPPGAGRFWCVSSLTPLSTLYMLTQTVDSPVLLAPRCEWFDLDPGLFHQLCLHPDLIALLPYDPLPGQGVRGGLGGWEDR